MRAVTRVVALVAVAGLCLGGLSGLAGAKAKNPVGSVKWCRNHPKSKLAACRKSTGGGGGSGGAPPPITLTVAPGPLVETGLSEVYAVVEVETSPAFSQEVVDIESLQLADVCGGAVLFGSLQPTAIYTADSVLVTLDADGNATVDLYGIDCAPGRSTIEADLTGAPYSTATGTLDAQPPQTTTAGVSGSPVDEVETGNTPASGDSDVYTVFTVETDPVYAEQPVELSSTQLLDRCGGGITWFTGATSSATASITGTLDDDGNASFIFTGISCAPGDSTVVADIEAGTNTTYQTTYIIDAPVPTI
jgi:hypothetical protein